MNTSLYLFSLNCFGYLQNQVLKTRQIQIKRQLHDILKKNLLDLSELVFSKILKSDRENGVENTTHLKITFSVFIVGSPLSAWRRGLGGGGVEPPTKFPKRGA